VDSPIPESGKTTVVEHLHRPCFRSVQMASLSSPALLTRMHDAEQRTILIDEADRSLNPDKEGVADLLAVLNSGYKRGGTRWVLVPAKGGQWEVNEMPTFAAVAMAGNNPNLPEDTPLPHHPRASSHSAQERCTPKSDSSTVPSRSGSSLRCHHHDQRRTGCRFFSRELEATSAREIPRLASGPALVSSARSQHCLTLPIRYTGWPLSIASDS
jgi:hypothetical protein